MQPWPSMQLNIKRKDWYICFFTHSITHTHTHTHTHTASSAVTLADDADALFCQCTHFNWPKYCSSLLHLPLHGTVIFLLLFLLSAGRVRMRGEGMHSYLLPPASLFPFAFSLCIEATISRSPFDGIARCAILSFCSPVFHFTATPMPPRLSVELVEKTSSPGAVKRETCTLTKRTMKCSWVAKFWYSTSMTQLNRQSQHMTWLRWTRRW